MNELISIIVPVYNIKIFLRECLDSILRQEYRCIEIIIVDDGSTDGSELICDEYATTYDNVKVIHQNNSGLTVTRRAGVRAAKGAYIGFVDGDDWIDPQMYKELYNILKTNDVDIVTSGGYREYANNETNSILGDSIPEGKYLIDEPTHYILNRVFSASFTNDEHLNGSICYKFFKRDIILETFEQMNDNVHGQMDDNVCVVGTVMKAKSIYISNRVYYHHREHCSSFTYSTNSKSMLQLNNAYLCLERIIKMSKYSDTVMPLLYEHVSSRFIDAFNSFWDNQQFKFPEFMFQTNIIPAGSNVILYGLGKVGMSYLQQFKVEKKYSLVAATDKRLFNISEYVNTSELKNMIYDYIIVAVKSKKIYYDIRSNLTMLGIDSTKIVWEKPLTFVQYYNFR